MSDWHFGMDYDMWLYPPVDWTAPDYDYELPEPIEAANIEGTLLVNAEDAIEQVHCLQAENATLRELVRDMHRCFVRGHDADAQLRSRAAHRRERRKHAVRRRGCWHAHRTRRFVTLRRQGAERCLHGR